MKPMTEEFVSSVSRKDVSGVPSDDPQNTDYYGEYDENGVDLSLLRYMLSLSPLERLKVMEQHARDTETLHEYGRKHWEAEARRDR